MAIWDLGASRYLDYTTEAVWYRFWGPFHGFSFNGRAAVTRNGSKEKERHAAMGHRSEPNPGTPGKDTTLYVEHTFY